MDSFPAVKKGRPATSEVKVAPIGASNLENTTAISTSQMQTKEQTDTLSIIILPRVTVQHDISAVIEDVRDGIVTNGWEDAWVSCYHEGKASAHGKVRILRAPGGVSFEARDGIDWHGTSTAEFRVGCRTLGIPAMPIRLPKHVYTPPDPIKERKITAFDVSPDSRLYATGHADGSIVIQSTGLASTNTPSTRRAGTPHLSTVLSLKFFPSSTVLLSSSSDLSIRIHDANLSVADTTITHHLDTVRVLQAHTAGVTGTGILDRGRNILSFGRDGSARLWDVGGGKEIVGRRWRAPRGSPILCGCLGDFWPASGHESDGADNRSSSGEGTSRAMLDGEVGTAGKVLFVGLHDGSVRGYELSTGHARFFSSGVDPSLTNSKIAPIDSIAYSSDKGLLIVGRRDGVIMLWDLMSEPSRSTTAIPATPGTAHEDEYNWSPTSIFKRNGAGVESLAFGRVIGPNDGALPSLSDRFPSILVGAEDGLFCRIGIDSNHGPVLLEEFVGVEAGDGVTVIRSLVLDDMEVNWSASDDGCVRRY